MSQKIYMFKFSIREHMIKKREGAPNNTEAKAIHSCLTLITEGLIISVWQRWVIITLNIPKH